MLLPLLLALASLAEVSVILDAPADFFGLPRPFKLPNPLGKSLKGTTTGPVVELISSTSTGLMGEAESELLSWEVAGVGADEEEEDEEFSFKVSFSFFGAEALVSFSVIKECV